jgi:hypothetical protein
MSAPSGEVLGHPQGREVHDVAVAHVQSRDQEFGSLNRMFQLGILT